MSDEINATLGMSGSGPPASGIGLRDKNKDGGSGGSTPQNAFAGPTQHAEQRQFSYRRHDADPLVHVAPWSAGHVIEHVAGYLKLLPDRRLIVATRAIDVADKLDVIAERLASRMGGTVWTSESLVPAMLADVEQAMAAALDAEPAPRTRQSIFVDRIALGSLDGRHDLLSSAEPSAGYAALLDRLNARHLIVVTIPPHLPLSILVTAVRLPWTAVWIEAMSEQFRLDENDLLHECGKALNEAETLLGVHNQTIQEQSLYRDLLALRWKLANDPAGSESPRAFILKEIDDAIRRARAGSDLSIKGRELIERVMQADYPSLASDRPRERPNHFGVIGQTAMIIYALKRGLQTDPVERLRPEDLTALTAILLPEESVPTGHLTGKLLAKFKEDEAEAERLHAPRPVTPAWDELLEEVAQKLPSQIGLQVDPLTHMLEPVPDLLMVDIESKVLEHRSPLQAFAQRFIKREAGGPTRFLLHETTVRLRNHLAEILVGLLRNKVIDEDDFSAVLAGYTPDNLDLIVPLDSDAAMIAVPGRKDTRPHVGDWTAHEVVLAKLDDPTKDDALRLAACRHVRGNLSRLIHQIDDSEAFLGRFLGRINRRPHRLTTWTLLAYLTLYGPRPLPVVLGQIVLSQFKDVDRDTLASHFREHRELMQRILSSAIEANGDAPPPVDFWADGLWEAVKAKDAPRIGEAVAFYTDDLIANYEISWIPRELFSAHRPSTLLASRFFDPQASGHDFKLMERLATRDPRHWARTLGRAADIFDEQTAPLKLEDLLANRLYDAFSAILTDIELDALPKVQQEGGVIYTTFWNQIGRDYRLPDIHGEKQLAELIVGSLNAPPPRHSDPCAILDLFPAAVLVNWRLTYWSAAPLPKDSRQDRLFNASLAALLRPLPPARRSALGFALRTLAAASDRLADQFERWRFERTAAYHRQRTDRILRLARLFENPIALQALMPPKSGDAAHE